MNKEAQRMVQKGPERKDGSDRKPFLPQWRMRRRRWEESLAFASAKREGTKFAMEPQVFNCNCGSIDCLGGFLCKRVEKTVVIPTPKKRRSRTLTPREVAMYFGN